MSILPLIRILGSFVKWLDQPRSISLVIVFMLVLSLAPLTYPRDSSTAYAQLDSHGHGAEKVCDRDAEEPLDPEVEGIDAKCGLLNEVVSHPSAEVYVDNVVFAKSYTDVFGMHTPLEGNKFLIVDVTLKNTGTRVLDQDPVSYAISFPEMNAWETKIRSGNLKECGQLSCSFVITSRAATKDTLQSVIYPGEAVRSLVYFEVPDYETDFFFLFEISGLRQSEEELAKLVAIDLTSAKFPPDPRPATGGPNSDLEEGSISTNGNVEVTVVSKSISDSVEVAGSSYDAPNGWKVYNMRLSVANKGDAEIPMNGTRMYLRDENDYLYVVFPSEASSGQQNRLLLPGSGLELSAASFVPADSQMFELTYFDSVNNQGKRLDGNVVVVPEFSSILLTVMIASVMAIAIFYGRFRSRLNIYGL